MKRRSILENIKGFREHKKLTQSELAQMLGLKQSTIAMWENGDSMPRTDKLPELAKIFNCTIDDLFSK